MVPPVRWSYGADPPEHTRLGFGATQWMLAHVVARCPLTLRKERTLAMRLDFVLEWRTGNSSTVVYDTQSYVASLVTRATSRHDPIS
jgi:hypothetical protein